MTLRALRVLREVDLIACEDTRRTRVLLQRHGIATPTTSYFEHNKLARGPQLLRMLEAGRSIALGLALLAGAATAYGVARATPLFALQTVRVNGTTPAVARLVQEELRPLLGTSLLAIDTEDLVARVETLPDVRSAQFDRAFPHALVVDGGQRVGDEARRVACDGVDVVGLQQPLAERVRRAELGDALHDRGRGEEVLLDELGKAARDALPAARDDCGMRNRKLERPAEERHDGKPVGESTDHRRLAERRQIVIVELLGHHVDDGRQHEQPGRDPFHAHASSSSAVLS